MKKIYLVLLLCASFVWSNAVPAYPGLITVNQEDGSTISFYLRGDEHFSYKTTEDGYLIAENANGIMEYAYFTDDNTFRTSGIKAHNLQDRSVNEQDFVASLQKTDALQPRFKAVRQQKMQAAAAPSHRKFPLKGSPRGLIILVSYTDVAFATPKANFENLANQRNYSANGGTGSIQDYFVECSNGQFSPVFDVYGPYTLPHERAYYGAVSGTQHDVRAGQMIIDACLRADADVNFADYDTDNNGFVDNIFVVFAGNNQADGGPDESIWPHRSSVSYYEPPQLDGVYPADYACTSEYKHARGTDMCGIGTFCHEFGHVLGLPDFYDTDYASGLDAMGRWDIMSNGSRNNDECTPPTYTAYERFYLGWLTPTALTNDSTVDCEGSYNLKSLISSNTAFLVSKTQHNLSGSGPNPKEFFMLEYRKMEGRDTYTGLAEGLLITHINYNPTAWSNNGPNNDRTCLGYYPVIPNRQQVYNNGSDLYPNIADHCSFTLHGETEPMLRRIINIADNDTSCSFDYVSPNERLTLVAHDIEAYMEPVETQFVVFGSNIAENLSVTIADNQNFSWRRHTADDSESYSHYAITISPDTAGNVRDSIDVKYEPRKVTYDEYSETKFSVKGEESSSLTKIAKFRYRNRRPVYITTPVAYEAENVTSNSADLSWSYVNDTIEGVQMGAKYYLDLYTVSPVQNKEVESFEDFPDKMGEGWSANFSSASTTYYKEGNKSVQFETAQDTLWSKEYLSDVTEISFWVKSISAKGTLKVEAQHETGGWATVKSLPLDTKTVGDQTGSLNGQKGYRKFRIYFVPDEEQEGKVALDCFAATTASTTTFACKNLLLTDTFYNATGLKANTEYKYVVRATDKDASGRYENISDKSNEVVLVTKDGSDPQQVDGATSIELKYVKDGDKYVVFVSEVIEDYALFIYGIDGRLVKQIPVTQTQVDIPQLLNGVYVLKYTKVGGNSRKDGFVKMYYDL